jgi:hypothetical protein
MVAMREYYKECVSGEHGGEEWVQAAAKAAAAAGVRVLSELPGHVRVTGENAPLDAPRIFDITLAYPLASLTKNSGVSELLLANGMKGVDAGTKVSDGQGDAIKAEEDNRRTGELIGAAVHMAYLEVGAGSDEMREKVLVWWRQTCAGRLHLAIGRHGLAGRAGAMRAKDSSATRQGRVCPRTCTSRCRGPLIQ